MGHDRTTKAFSACTATITDPATGALTLTDCGTSIGTLDFMAGTGSGTFHDPTANPTDGNWVAQRR